MEASPKTVIALKDQANANIKEYCAKHNEDFETVKKYIHDKCDSYNLSTPTDFYLRVYNMSVEFLKAK